MAAPTPTTWTQWDGSRGMTYWRSEWTAGAPDNFSDAVVVDISALAPAPASVKVRAIRATINGDLEATLEFDATTDQLIHVFEGQSDVTIETAMDYTDGPNNARVPSTGAAGFVGDIIVSTANAAALDELTLILYYAQKS